MLSGRRAAWCSAIAVTMLIAAASLSAAQEPTVDGTAVCTERGVLTIVANRQVRVVAERGSVVRGDLITVAACTRGRQVSGQGTILGDTYSEPVYAPPALVLRGDYIAYVAHSCTNPPSDPTDLGCSSSYFPGFITVQRVSALRRIRHVRVLPESFTQTRTGHTGAVALSAGLGVAWTTCSGNLETDFGLKAAGVLQTCGARARSVRVWRYGRGDARPVLLSDTPGIDPTRLVARNGRVYWRTRETQHSRRLP